MERGGGGSKKFPFGAFAYRAQYPMGTLSKPVSLPSGHFQPHSREPPHCAHSRGWACEGTQCYTVMPYGRQYPRQWMLPKGMQTLMGNLEDQVARMAHDGVLQCAVLLEQSRQ